MRKRATETEEEEVRKVVLEHPKRHSKLSAAQYGPGGTPPLPIQTQHANISTWNHTERTI